MNPLIALYEAARLAGISAALLHGICFTESRLQPALNVNDGGSSSYGLCQIKHATASRFNSALQPSALMQPGPNAQYAALYLAYQLERYGGDITSAISAYNAGSATTRNGAYVRQVLVNAWRGPFQDDIRRSPANE